MQAVLIVTSGTYEGRKVILRSGQQCQIGRTEWTDFSIPHDGHLSGKHFSINCETQSCTLKDLGSTNGTQVNGKPVTTTVLHDGDTIQAGHTTFRIQIENQPVTPASPPKPPEKILAQSDVSAPQEPAIVDNPVKAIARTIEEESFLPETPEFAGGSRWPYDAALQDENPEVQREALLAAVWKRQPWLLDYCRWQAEHPQPGNWNAIWLLAVLGRSSDGPLIQQVGRNEQLGAQRFGILASFGHPALMPDIVRAISSEDPETAVVAASAFEIITGADIASDSIVTIPAESQSEGEPTDQEAPDEQLAPNAVLAQQHWNDVKSEYGKGNRWRRGLNLSQGLSAKLLDELDMEGRWEALLRAHYREQWNGCPQHIVRLRHSVAERTR